MSSARLELRETLPKDREYREAYADEILNLLVCTQLRVLREQRGMTQEAMAEVLGSTQTAVSRLENVNYAAWNVRTLKNLAKVLGVRLRITFETFGSLWQDVALLNREDLQRPDVEDDPEVTSK